MKLNLSELRRLEGNATPIPWEFRNGSIHRRTEYGSINFGHFSEGGDSWFCIEFRNHFLQLLEIVEAVKQYDELDITIGSSIPATGFNAERDRLVKLARTIHTLLEDVEIGDE